MAEQDPQAAPAPAPADPPAAEPEGGHNAVILKGEIEIYPSARMPHLDQGPIKAYAAKSRTRERAFAYVCERNLVPQIYNSSMYYGLSSPSLAHLIGAGVVEWTPLKQQRYVFVYEDKLGKPIANSTNAMGMGLKNDLVMNTIVRNIVPTLKDMRDADFVHGNIRVTNLYDGGSAGLDRVMLGECLSTPCGFLQPAVYETVERASCDPLGRGPAGYEDDMYAFGVTLAILLRESDPMAGFSNDEIIAEKIEQGTYAAITGKERITGSLLECLRGLLNDDWRQRWTIDDLVTWMEGRRVHSKQSTNLRLKASRPLEFAQEKYLRPHILALDLPKHPKETARLTEGHDLTQWLTRSLQDKPTEERIDKAITEAQSAGTTGFYPERLACYIALALSPSMPLMYRGVKFMPSAFGALMADAAQQKRDLNPFVEIINNQMALYWIGVQESGSADSNEVAMKFDTCRAFLRQPIVGYGIERCLYFLSPECQCMSEKLKDHYVRTAEDLLNAYETMAAKGVNPQDFFDRHIIAFLSVRDRQVIDPYIPDLNSDEKHRQILATVRVLAAIQKRSQMPAVPAVTKWLVDRFEPMVERFHDRDARTRLRAQLEKLGSKGDISKLSGLFDNPQIFQDDFNAFRNAMKAFAGLRAEHSSLSNKLDNDKAFGAGTGRQFAAIVSGGLASIGMVIYMVLKFSGGGSGF